MAQLSKYLSNDYLSSIKNLQIKTKHILQGTMLGWHNSPFHGYSSEFSQYRNYALGDDMKHFDWKIYGKSEKLMVKQYRDETNANIYLMLDSSASMDYKGSGNITKMEYANVLSASLAMLAHQQRDRICLIHGADELSIKTSLKNTSGNVRNIHRILEELKPLGQTDLGRMFNQLAPFLKNGSITFILSDLWQNSKAITDGLKKITHKSKAATLVQVLTPDEINFINHGNVELKDLETGEKIKISSVHLKEEYLDTLAEHQFKIQSECAKLNIRFIKIPTDKPFYQAMREVLYLSR